MHLQAAATVAVTYTVWHWKGAQSPALWSGHVTTRHGTSSASPLSFIDVPHEPGDDASVDCFNGLFSQLQRQAAVTHLHQFDTKCVVSMQINTNKPSLFVKLRLTRSMHNNLTLIPLQPLQLLYPPHQDHLWGIKPRWACHLWAWLPLQLCPSQCQ
jgi:hypothetical protein